MLCLIVLALLRAGLLLLLGALGRPRAIGLLLLLKDGR